MGSFEIFYLHCLVCGQYSDRIHLVLMQGISQMQLAVKACAKYDKKRRKKLLIIRAQQSFLDAEIMKTTSTSLRHLLRGSEAKPQPHQELQILPSLFWRVLERRGMPTQASVLDCVGLLRQHRQVPVPRQLL